MNSWFPRTTAGLNTWTVREWGFYSTDSIVPVVTEAGITDVEVEVLEWIDLVLTEQNVPQLSKANSESIVPVLTTARGALAITGTFPKSATDSVIPVVSEANSYAGTGAIASTDSVIPVIAESNAIESSYIEALSTESVVPVVSEANTLLQTGLEVAAAESIVPVLTEVNAYVLAFDDKASTDSIVPVIAEVQGTVQYAGFVYPTSSDTLVPVFTIVNEVTGQSDEVDGIAFIARPTGTIRISPV